MTRPSQDNYCLRSKNRWGTGPSWDGGSDPQMGAEFVPMINSAGQAQSMLNEIGNYKAEWTRANAHYLLGYAPKEALTIYAQCGN